MIFPCGRCVLRAYPAVNQSSSNRKLAGLVERALLLRGTPSGLEQSTLVERFAAIVFME